MNSHEFTFTKVPNIILDEYLPLLSGSEYIILSVIFRKTIGFNKNKDRIALSTFEKMSGQARSTVVKAVKELVRKEIISKDTSTIPTTYSINQKIFISSDIERDNAVRKTNYSLIVKPDVVGILNQRLVQNSNTQKKALKENERKSTTTISFENYMKICSYWNKLFGNSLNANDPNLESIIKSAMQEFSVDQLIKAMFNRSRAEYYKIEKPYLRSNPNSFFKYPKTIENDFNRSSSKVYNYEEVCELVLNNNLDMSKDFIRLEEILDAQGRALWQKI